MEVILKNLRENFSRNVQVTTMSSSALFLADARARIRHLQPDIIHHIPGPTLLSLGLLRLLRSRFPTAKIVISYTHPAISRIPAWVLRGLHPDLALVQSERVESQLVAANANVAFLPNGVDIERFAPVRNHARQRIRERFGIRESDAVVLHVGPIRRRRNVAILAKLTRIGLTPILIGRERGVTNNRLRNELVRNGVKVISTYVDNVSEYYMMADVYIFPVFKPIASVQIPLSVLEAMACNSRVVTTPFGGLPRLFERCEGLWYATTNQKLIEHTQQAVTSSVPSMTRTLVTGLAWPEIARMVEEHYRRLVG